MCVLIDVVLPHSLLYCNYWWWICS